MVEGCWLGSLGFGVEGLQDWGFGTFWRVRSGNSDFTMSVPRI